MIVSFADKALERFYLSGGAVLGKKIPANLRSVLQRKLDILNYSTCLADLRIPPANHLEALKGNLAGKHSIRVNSQWRLVFVWQRDQAYEIELVDYH